MKSRFSLKPEETFNLNVPIGSEPQRLDHFLVTQYEDSSRSFFQNLINAGYMSVNGNPAKPSMTVRPGDIVFINMPPNPIRSISNDITNSLPIAVLHEHADFVVLSKPAGLVVHQPHKNSTEVTLVDWILNRYCEVTSVGLIERPGIVHRLDKDTSGIMLVARTPHAHAKLSDMFKNREIKKTYLALVEGHPPASGTIDYKINRHPTDPTKMAHYTGIGREAQTHYTTIEYYKQHALMQLRPVTGRTHQIRVHCSGIGHPLLGDAVYGSSSKLFSRQALHAHKISFEFGGEPFDFTAPLPDDFSKTIAALKVS